MEKTIVVIGSSKGIGAEITKHLSNSGNNVIGVSRSPSQNCRWIKADITSATDIKQLSHELGNLTVDALIFSAGIWEEKGFSPDYSFIETSPEETQRIMQVNVVAPIEITKCLIKNLSLSNNPRALYLGAMSGTENQASSQVAYCSSKFGLRGAIQSLRHTFQPTQVGFTVINPGNVATEEVLSDIKQGITKEQKLILITDIVQTIDWILSLSTNVEIGDVNLSQKIR